MIRADYLVISTALLLIAVSVATCVSNRNTTDPSKIDDDGASPIDDDTTTASWTAMESGTAVTLEGVWGSAHNNVFAVATDANHQALILRYDGVSWSQAKSGPQGGLYAITGLSAQEIFAAGIEDRGSDYFGLIMRYDGSAWSKMEVPTTTTYILYGVWASSPSDVFAVGSGASPPPSSDSVPIVLHFDGESWSVNQPATLLPNLDLHSVWGASPSNVFAIGTQTVQHFDGASWNEMEQWEYGGWAIWGTSATNVWGGGYLYGFLHYDGSDWSVIHGQPDWEPGIFGLWGTSQSDIFASSAGNYGSGLADGGAIIHFDGAAWMVMKTPSPTARLCGIWGSSPTDVFAVGEGGAILHYGPPQ